MCDFRILSCLSQQQKKLLRVNDEMTGINKVSVHGSKVHSATRTADKGSEVQRLGSLGIKPIESITKGNSAKRLTLNPAFSGKPYNPDRADAKLI
jgi:hypothetical protein